ncbi:MAG: hypothetical protein SFV23_24440 [Planctomycetaceae bacterium]|nr:hypothetical protein [Planctomycetaceae bacterium]
MISIPREAGREVAFGAGKADFFAAQQDFGAAGWFNDTAQPAVFRRNPLAQQQVPSLRLASEHWQA